ncbi:hypothetical protein ACPSM1_30895, partial [Micromonospora chersina]|uniref:hypothetical protein n=1 Tax=Micromonospora chersina TaxID=47854 RepID=UPI003C7F0CA2
IRQSVPAAPAVHVLHRLSVAKPDGLQSMVNLTSHPACDQPEHAEQAAQLASVEPSRSAAP